MEKRILSFVVAGMVAGLVAACESPQRQTEELGRDESALQPEPRAPAPGQGGAQRGGADTAPQGGGY